MLDDLRFPIGLQFPGGQLYKGVVNAGPNWQIVESKEGMRFLIAETQLAERWRESNLVGDAAFANFSFGKYKLEILSSGRQKRLSVVSEAESSFSKMDAMAFAVALKETRKVNPTIPLQDSLYIEKLSRLLPTYNISTAVADDVLLGYWLTGGVRVSVNSVRRLRQLVGAKFSSRELAEILLSAGFDENLSELERPKRRIDSTQEQKRTESGFQGDTGHRLSQLNDKVFTLAGRPELTKFFNEHVIDVIKNSEQYKQLGINFPSAIVLHGPPGTGKTYAVEQLVEFLEWPSYEVDSSSIGSPYIHETGRKIAEIFDLAIENSPSVLVIDEMEAFLGNRETNVGHHRVEELAEFLRRIPEAVKNDVLIISMTNRIDMIDGAILRRGRFDHVIEVGYANQEEINDLLQERLAKIPVEEGIDTLSLAIELSGRPLSDVDFVIREGSRLAVRSEKMSLDQDSLLKAIGILAERPSASESGRRIGFL